MQSQIGDILHQQQIKSLITQITQLDIRDYGNKIWFRQDENLQKLNMQLHVNALMKNDQYILQQCVTQDKFRVLIYELIVSATWKKRVLPLISQEKMKMNSLKLYLAIYHQSVVCNILEVFMFHRTAVDQSGDLLIQVIDYCYQKISRQIAERIRKKKLNREQQGQPQPTKQQKTQSKITQIMQRTPTEQLTAQLQQFQFGLFIMSISILRYVTDYIKHLQIGIVHHLLVECNIYALLVPLIQERPWLRVNGKEEREIFQNNKWGLVPKSEYGRLPKTQAQVWIMIYNMFMDQECRKKYQLNDQRKNTLLRLRKYLNEVLLDQIPQLSHMLRALQQLSLMNVPTHLTINPFVVQQMPIIATNICMDKNWKEIAEEHSKRLAMSMDQQEKQHIQRLADLYTNNNVEGLLEGFKCKKCDKEASKRCSKCKHAWYCSRECQVSDWPQHKVVCNQRAKELKDADEGKKEKEKEKEVVVSKKPQIDQLD